jgi:trans-2,3-dihydro-3-hydroxyanthranilate isomerase
VKRRIFTLDVFTNKAYAGNPLAVVTDGDGISAQRMQAVAREMNLSETVFIQRPSNNRALARLRIFTTSSELPLAGHPVIGTWFLLAELGVVPAAEGSVHVLQQTGAGILPVEIEFHDGRPQRVTMTQKPAQFRRAPCSAAPLAKALGLRASDIDSALPIEVVSTGIFNMMVPIVSRAALARIRMDTRALYSLLAKSGVMAYCFNLTGGGKAQTRGLLPWGVQEDPATGSAAGSLGAYLVRYGKLALGQQLTIQQGIEMGRPSEINVSITEEKRHLVPKVSGSAVRIMEGTIEA